MRVSACVRLRARACMCVCVCVTIRMCNRDILRTGEITSRSWQ